MNSSVDYTPDARSTIGMRKRPLTRAISLLAGMTCAFVLMAATPGNAQVSQAEETSQCNSPTSCQALVRYFEQKASGQPHPYREQLTVLAARAYLVYQMFVCEGIRVEEQRGILMPAYEQALASIESTVYNTTTVLSMQVAASHDDQTTAQLARITAQFAVQAANVCRPHVPAPSPY